MNLFDGLTVEALIEIERRLELELEDKGLPCQRKEEVESCLYHIKEAKRVKKGFYTIDKGGLKECQENCNIF